MIVHGGEGRQVFLLGRVCLDLGAKFSDRCDFKLTMFT